MDQPDKVLTKKMSKKSVASYENQTLRLFIFGAHRMRRRKLFAIIYFRYGKYQRRTESRAQ